MKRLGLVFAVIAAVMVATSLNVQADGKDKKCEMQSAGKKMMKDSEKTCTAEQKQMQKKMKGMEKQKEKKMEQMKKEMDKGSEKGQEARKEHSRKWWKFWGSDESEK